MSTRAKFGLWARLWTHHIALTVCICTAEDRSKNGWCEWSESQSRDRLLQCPTLLFFVSFLILSPDASAFSSQLPLLHLLSSLHFLPPFLSLAHPPPPPPFAHPVFQKQLCNCANDAEKACCQHIPQAAGATLT